MCHNHIAKVTIRSIARQLPKLECWERPLVHICHYIYWVFELLSQQESDYCNRTQENLLDVASSLKFYLCSYVFAETSLAVHLLYLPYLDVHAM